MAAQVTVQQVVKELRQGLGEDGTPEDWTAFCKYWPNSIKPALNWVRPYLVERFGVVADLVVKGLMQGGDYLYREKKC